MKESKIVLAVILVMVVLIFGFFVLISNVVNKEEKTGNEMNTLIDTNGKQVIDLTAKGGYFPKVIEAKANTEYILRIKTSNTYDCSLSFRIPSLGISKELPNTGVTEILIPSQSVGTELNGTCSMGMYSVKIKFN